MKQGLGVFINYISGECKFSYTSADGHSRSPRQLKEYVNRYNTACPPVRGDNPRTLASGFSPLQANKTVL